MKQVSLHFVAVYSLVSVMTFLNGWLTSLTGMDYLLFLVKVFVVYLVIWAMIYFANYQSVNRMNQALKK